jgi:rfaE bifunctional protein kinase chain/domain
MISLERLDLLLERFPSLTIGLVGDLFLDRYLEIDPELQELSIETGLEAYQVTQVRNSPGALGTVINNLAALEVGQLVPVSVLGDDGQAYDLRKSLDAMPVDRAHLMTDPERNTPTYTKPMKRDDKGTWRELNRLDLRNRRPLRAEVEKELIERIGEVFQRTDGLIVLDQVNEEGWGVVTPKVRQALGQLAREHPQKLMFIDSRAHLACFDFGTLKPNEHECLWALGGAGASNAADLPQAAQALARRTGQDVYCTCGARGIYVAGGNGSGALVPAVAVKGPIDTVGAGDSVTSGIVSALLAGAAPIEAAAIGNLVASITIRQLGTTGTARRDEVRAVCQEQSTA